MLTLRGDGSVEHVEMSRASARGSASLSVDLRRAAVRAVVTERDGADTTDLATETPPAPFLAVSFGRARGGPRGGSAPATRRR